MHAEPATEVVLLTPLGRGAVASVLVVGSAAVAAVASAFRSHRALPLAEQPINKILVGRWGGPAGEEVVVCRRSEHQIEVHAHGGLVAVRAIIDHLVAHGCRERAWSECVAEHEPNAIAAAARVLLAKASTARTASILLDQYTGALARELALIRQAIVTGEQTSAAARLRRLLQLTAVGLHLVEPFRVVLAGEPNVGKSSLINALVGYERSIVLDEPGTTRDVVTAQTALDGWPVELADTAGLRRGGDVIEQMGVAQAQVQLQQAHLVVLVFDSTRPFGAAEAALCARWDRALVALNKCDLLTAGGSSHADGCLVSALTGQGIDKLVEEIVARIAPARPQPGEAVPFLPEHVMAITAALAAVDCDQPVIAAERLGELIDVRC